MENQVELDREASGIQAFDLIVIDLEMVGVTDEVLHGVRTRNPSAKLAVTYGACDRTRALSALSAGVHGIMPKSMSGEAAAAAFDRVLNGDIFVPLEVIDEPVLTPKRLPPAPTGNCQSLPKRQREILDLILEGKSNKEIARELGLAEGTVKNHVSVLLRNLGVTNRAGAAVAGVEARHGLH